MTTTQFGIHVEEAIKLYEEGKTVSEIGKILGFSGSGIWKCLKRYEVKLRISGPKGRPYAHKTRGLEFLGADGRWWVRGMRSGTRRNSKRRAVVVMERKIGGPIPKGFHVHHINRDKTDDRIENLQLLAHSEHTGLTFEKANQQRRQKSKY